MPNSVNKTATKFNLAKRTSMPSDEAFNHADFEKIKLFCGVAGAAV